MFIAVVMLNLSGYNSQCNNNPFIKKLHERLGVCGYTRTRGFTRTRPVPAGRVRVGYMIYGYGSGRVERSRVRVYP